MAKRDAMLPRVGRARFQQRILNPGSLLAHGFKRFTDDCRTHAHRAQIADFLDFQQVRERIGRRRRY